MYHLGEHICHYQNILVYHHWPFSIMVKSIANTSNDFVSSELPIPVLIFGGEVLVRTHRLQFLHQFSTLACIFGQKQRF